MSNTCNEIWKDIKGWEGVYQVSNKGRVRSIKTFYFAKKLVHSPTVSRGGHILKGTYDKDGYRHVHLHARHKNMYASVHRLVASEFIPNHLNKGAIDHINGVKDDNRVENLRWVTTLENQNNPITKKRISNAKKKPVIGTNLNTGEEIFFECAEDTRALGFCPSKVNACRRGERKSHKGYTWRYANKK